MSEVIRQSVPELLRRHVNEVCRMPADQFHVLPPEELPEPVGSLLNHSRDMTSTLQEFHSSALRVEVLQEGGVGDLYCREVFLRTIVAGAVAEYGVIAIKLEQFSSDQIAVIKEGKIPLGALLHQFQIPFESAPICFFSVTPVGLAQTRLGALGAQGSLSYGRFNKLAKPGGEPLAWIMEILPNFSPPKESAPDAGGE